MDISHLKEFITLAETLNYSRSSEQLFITQSVLSRHIAHLEQFFGAQLLVRNTRTVRLTPIGNLLYKEAKAILKCYEESIYRVHSAISGITGSLNFGFWEGAGKKLIAPLILHMKKSLPNILLQPFSFELGPVSQALIRGDIDIGITLAMPPLHTSDYISKKLYVENFCLAVNSNHPLSSSDQVSLAAIAREPQIAPSRKWHPGVLDWQLDCFKKRGLVPNIIQECPRVA